MPMKENEAVPEGNGPVPQKEEFGSGQPTLEDVYQMANKVFEMWDRKIDKFFEKEGWRSMDQRLTCLLIEHDARQPRLAMEANGQEDTKTRERTEGATTAVQAMHGDSCSANRVDPDPLCSTSFGDHCTGPPALPCPREDALVDNGAATPKSCLPPLEMRTTTAAGGLLPTGETCTETKIIFNQPPLRLYSTEETNLWTLILSVSYESSFFWKNNLSAAPSSRQNQCKIGCSIQAVLKVVSAPTRFLGTWRALLCGETMRVGAAGGDLQLFLEDRSFGVQKPSGVVHTKYSRRAYGGQSLALRS